MSFGDLFRPYPELKTGIVNLKSGTSFRGVIWKIAGEFVALRNVEMLQDMGKTARHVVDGEVVVNQSEIDFIQVVS
jgi:hypothetical protein